MDNKIAIVLTTFPSENLAREVSKAMLFEGLVACVQIGKEISSMYFWQEEFFQESEIPISLKIPEAKLEEAKQFLMKTHPYECPQWIELHANASQSYATWVNSAKKRQRI